MTVFDSFSRCLLCLLVLLAAYTAQAALPEGAIDTAKQCTQHFPRQERIHGIPTHLLAAISATESGRWNDTLGMVLPWPWTINAEGKGFYFDTKAQAIAKVREFQKQGMKSIDIGCMQVNLKHHPDAFASLEQAFDPKYNVAYAARFLRSNYDDLKNWDKATAAYHSRTPKFGNKYLAQVEKSWSAISGKVRTARANRPPRKSYRVIKVRDADDGLELASLEPDNVRANTRPATDFFTSLQNRAARVDNKRGLGRVSDGSTSATNTGVRRGLSDVDRLGRVRNAQRTKIISVRDANEAKETTLVRPQTVSSQPVLLKPDNGQALRNLSNRSGGSDSATLVTQHGPKIRQDLLAADSAPQKSKTQGPKFVFVQ